LAVFDDNKMGASKFWGRVLFPVWFFGGFFNIKKPPVSETDTSILMTGGLDVDVIGGEGQDFQWLVRVGRREVRGHAVVPRASVE
jgi:hypothetical protein